MCNPTYPFRSAEEQITQVRAWNVERRWGFTEREFLAVERSIPKWPADPLCAPILVPYLPSHHSVTSCIRTFHALWKIAAGNHPHAWLHETVATATSPETLRPYDTQDTGPGMRWEVIDFGAGRGRQVKDMIARGPRPWPHAGILAAAALHPEWVRCMNGIEVPYVYLPGFLVTSYPVSERAHRLKGRPGMMLLSYADHLRIDVMPLHFSGNLQRAIPYLVEVLQPVI